LKRILVAPLNWGLGHATRCIPVINHLLDKGCEVILASDGRALEVLQKEFPKLEAHSIPGYNISYQRKSMVINLGLQFPHIVRTVFREEKWTRRFVQNHQIDAIISDNRFGVFHPKVPSVFISHQIKIPIPGKLLNFIGNRLNQRYIKRFQRVWVPDFPGQDNLTGPMSHGTPLDDKIEFVGAVSRMTYFETEQLYDLCVVLSGPEPQRTRLEQILLSELASLPYKTLFVRGIPKGKQRAICSDNLEMVSFMTGEELNKAMLQSGLIISRSGYTTIMDLAVLGKKALFIPTPGQKEQEDLAGYFAGKHIFHTKNQDNINLSEDIPAAMRTSGMSRNIAPNHLLHSVIDKWLLDLGHIAPDSPAVVTDKSKAN
jgi:uncharacterized protein (TIGR00661 family)